MTRCPNPAVSCGFSKTTTGLGHQNPRTSPGHSGSRKVHQMARDRGGVGSLGGARPVRVCISMLGLNMEARHTSLAYHPPPEVRQNGGGMPVGPNPVPGGESTAIHVRFRIPGRIITRMRFGPQGSGPIGMGTRNSTAPVVEVGQGTKGDTLSQALRRTACFTTSGGRV